MSAGGISMPAVRVKKTTVHCRSPRVLKVKDWVHEYRSMCWWRLVVCQYTFSCYVRTLK